MISLLSLRVLTLLVGLGALMVFASSYAQADDPSPPMVAGPPPTPAIDPSAPPAMWMPPPPKGTDTLPPWIAEQVPTDAPVNVPRPGQ